MAGTTEKSPPDQRKRQTETERERQKKGKRFRMFEARLEWLYHTTPAVYGAKQLKPTKALGLEERLSRYLVHAKK